MSTSNLVQFAVLLDWPSQIFAILVLLVLTFLMFSSIGAITLITNRVLQSVCSYVFRSESLFQNVSDFLQIFLQYFEFSVGLFFDLAYCLNSKIFCTLFRILGKATS